MKKKKNTKSKAFTLAEILITLSIIGVVAALTIPTLIQRTGNEEMVSKLNKAYSTLAQATEMIITERGGVKTWLTNSDTFYDIYKEHLRNAKVCGSAQGCFKGQYKRLNGENNGTWDTSTSYRRLILSDGVQVMFYFVSNDCSSKGWGSKDVCAWINVDLNGQKAPNTLGRDVFSFVIKDNGLYPAGCDDENYCDKNTAGEKGAGHGCTCRIISEGAINY